jgi:hypothetical protein
MKKNSHTYHVLGRTVVVAEKNGFSLAKLRSFGSQCFLPFFMKCIRSHTQYFEIQDSEGMQIPT